MRPGSKHASAKPLGRKQAISSEAFQRTFDELESILSRPTYDRHFAEAVARVRSLSKQYGRIAFAWSGGKDSLALELVCRAAGVTDCVYGMTSGLEYPAFLQWVTNHMPPELEVIANGWDMNWLVDHQSMMFPQSSDVAVRWFSSIQHAAQEKYFRARGIRCLILGRRWADGNYTGRGKGQWVYEAQGVIRASPIANWSHELVLGAIRYGFGWGMAELPPFYRWPRGWRCGTHAWPARQWCESTEHAWSEIWQIDAGIVRDAAAAGIHSAAEFAARQSGA